MDLDYQQMGTDDRIRHHDALADEGFGWCPECGETLIWDLPTDYGTPHPDNRAPIVCGDVPPLTAEQLLMTAPAVH